jgi:hypothetical protein
LFLAQTKNLSQNFRKKVATGEGERERERFNGLQADLLQIQRNKESIKLPKKKIKYIK